MKGIETTVSSRDTDVTNRFSLSPSLAQKSLSLSSAKYKRHAKECPQRLWRTSQELNSAVFNENMIYQNMEFFSCNSGTKKGNPGWFSCSKKCSWLMIMKNYCILWNVFFNEGMYVTFCNAFGETFKITCVNKGYMRVLCNLVWQQCYVRKCMWYLFCNVFVVVFKTTCNEIVYKSCIYRILWEVCYFKGWMW